MTQGRFTKVFKKLNCNGPKRHDKTSTAAFDHSLRGEGGGLPHTGPAARERDLSNFSNAMSLKNKLLHHIVQMLSEVSKAFLPLSCFHYCIKKSGKHFSLFVWPTPTSPANDDIGYSRVTAASTTTCWL